MPLTHPSSPLQSYLDDPNGSLEMSDIRIGRLSIGKLVITSREAAIQAQEILNAAYERSRRARSTKNGTRYPEPLPVGTPGRSLSVEIDDYIRNRGDYSCLARETVEATSRTLRLLLMTCGDIPVTRIDHAHIYKLWDLIRWAPDRLLSDPEYCRFTYDQAVARGKQLNVTPPAPATLEKHRRFLSTFFKKLEKSKAIGASPMVAFDEIKKDLVVDPNKPERLFDDAELKRIFDHGTYVPWASKYPHRWWLPILGLCTGARINEIAQLKLADVVQESGVWCIRIQKTVDPDLAHKTRNRSRQRLKGKSAIRTLPIPSQVLDAGFLDFVEDIRACGHPRLFPHLTAGVNRKTGESNQRYSQAVLNQFSTYLKSLGFGKGIGLHAFRHTIATELHHEGVPDEDIALLTGHSISKKVPVLHEAYFHKKPQLARRKQIDLLNRYAPPVQLPIYQRGQFAKQLSDPGKFYP
ncbi:site-specific integrase [Stenotrophomonas maltophilia group sp. msm4]|uniref:site-specific integrase n=1 Tax=Stenotrophomonas maltophilia group sp. msm4 TaxID=3061100 RepID=UPI002893F4B4|nr:site-specific integrase [Stenotrophomonas maltophilia group sp. msm4]MDT3488785.1 site-specific integrase [Stenotrophomonas maltophilia group sp. msm4]